MDQPLGAAEEELDIVHEADRGPASRVEIVIRGGGDPGSWGVRNESLQSGERAVRVFRSVERFDPMPGRASARLETQVQKWGQGDR